MNMPAAVLPDIRLSSAELQTALRADILRRHAELTAISWLGRAWLAAPWLFQAVMPAVFQLSPYENDRYSLITQSEDDCVSAIISLKESSVVQRGIPVQLRVQTRPGTLSEPAQIVAVKLVGVGCDLERHAAAEAGAEARSGDAATLDVRAVCNCISEDQATRRLVVQAITQALSERLPLIAAAAKAETDLVASTPPANFRPRHDLFALEGSTEKWLQQVSGYYFAESQLQALRFASKSDAQASFLFYYDATEPFNAQDPTRNVNPEVVCCLFD